MWKIKTTYCAFAIDKHSSETFESKKGAEKAMLLQAKTMCEMFNLAKKERGDRFEVREYEDMYADEKGFSYYPVSVAYIHESSDNGENGCEVRVMAGYEAVEVTED